MIPITPSGSQVSVPLLALAARLWCGTFSGCSRRSALTAKYCAVSSATKISANNASARGLPDSRTIASAKASREERMRSRRSLRRAARSAIGIFDHVACVGRARATISGMRDGEVLSKQPRASPVAGLIEGIVPTEMTMAAIRGILTENPAVGRNLVCCKIQSGGDAFRRQCRRQTHRSDGCGIETRPIAEAHAHRQEWLCHSSLRSTLRLLLIL